LKILIVSYRHYSSVVVSVVPKEVQRALDNDDDLETLADPCGNSEFGDDVTALFPPVVPATTSTSTSRATTTTTTTHYYWRSRNYGGLSPDDHIYLSPGVLTTREDPAGRALLPTPSTPRELNAVFCHCCNRL